MSVLSDLTVVTVTKDNLIGLKKTHASLRPVLGKCTWIVQDGNSADGTIRFLKSLRVNKSQFYSEPDSGIFHAMNTALIHVNTKYVWFLNAGDELLSIQSLEESLNLLDKSKKSWLVAGAILSDPKGQRIGYWETPTFPQSWRALGIQSWCHQATIYKTKFLFKGGGYDASSIIADWSTALILERLEKPLVQVEPIAVFLTGGLSSSIDQKLWIHLHHQGREIAGLTLTRRPILLAILNHGTFWISQGKFGSSTIRKLLEKMFSRKITSYFLDSENSAY
jgi:putative colanic acid biosynthesis glycosyltransferase